MSFILPDLPEIVDVALKNDVLTHKSLTITPVGNEADIEKPNNYERLSIFGGKILSMMLMWRCYDMRPYLRPVKLDVRHVFCTVIVTLKQVYFHRPCLS